MERRKKISLILFIALILSQCFGFGLWIKPEKARADVTPVEIFNDNFTATSGNGTGDGGSWDPASGGWRVDDSTDTYKHEDPGVEYQDSTSILYENDFSDPSPFKRI